MPEIEVFPSAALAPIMNIKSIACGVGMYYVCNRTYILLLFLARFNFFLKLRIVSGIDDPKVSDRPYAAIAGRLELDPIASRKCQYKIWI